MAKVITLGEILVEIMAEDKGRGFREPLQLVGPFPSGAPAIFIDQVAKLGQPCGIIACVGDDDFGWLTIKRLADDGVSTGCIEVRPGAVTGTAFVRYRPEGERDFVFNINGSASGDLCLTDAARQSLEGSGHLHISGSSLFSPRIIAIVNEAVQTVKSGGGSFSFDPNVRGDLVSHPALRSVFRSLLAQCDIFLPSGPELTLLTDAATEDAAVREILGIGATCVVIKRGPKGAEYHGPDGDLYAHGYGVEEVDPTGAGDCFDATFVTCRLQGRSIEESLQYANAAGAWAVGTKGPMEGTSTFAQLDQLRERARPVHALRLKDLMASARTSFREAGRAKEPGGVTSVCSGHPLVLEAAMLQAGADGTAVLIEATCNQVNHQGGYTGLTPATFRQEVHRIAERAGFQRERIVLGGDHLGPSPWRHLPAEKALQEAETMVAEYVAAGYRKIHLDCSMGCRDEPDHVGDALSAERAARLVEVAERVAAGSGTAPPYYVVGTEVPTPGGALHQIKTLEVTTASAVLATLEAHRQAFAAHGTTAAFDRVIALVAQPGVEFDNQNVVVYRPELARELRGALTKMPGLVFEAHSTDYQPPESLVDLVRDGFSVLKVGPGLTFSMRQALYGLDYMAATLDPDWQQHSLMTTMEHEMLASPGHWSAYYPGIPTTQKQLRHFSYSDRIRYYWAGATPQEAVHRLFSRLSAIDIPLPLVSQFLPTLYERVAGGELTLTPRALVIEAVRDVLRSYALACGQPTPALRQHV